MSNYVNEYQDNPKILGTIESDEDGTGVRFIEEAEVVEDDGFNERELPDGMLRTLEDLGERFDRFVQSALPADEVRVVDPTTGGMKGSKLARFDMIPADVLWELAEHYGKGEAKYPSDPETGQPNWHKGYDWRLSVAALQRHLHQFLMGQDYDEETGTSHLVAVMWHAAALRWFQLHGRGKDYRDVANGRAA